MTAIVINNIYKSFDSVQAIDGIIFNVENNEMFGIVGPDGAGKTTTIRILCGLTKPDKGEAKVLGKDSWRESALIKNEIGYLSQKFSLYTDLTVDENIEFFADIHGVKNYKGRRDELLDFMRLKSFRTFLAGNLSGGMKQKLALACTLIHKPKIIFLDEPTTGVDPVSRRDFWKILSNLLKDGITILITTPYMDEAERFNRIIMMNKGKILDTGTPSEIKNKFKSEILEVVCEPIRDAAKILKEKLNLDVQLFGDRLNTALENESDKNEIIKELTLNGIKITDTRIKQASLENIFISLMKN